MKAIAQLSVLAGDKHVDYEMEIELDRPPLSGSSIEFHPLESAHEGCPDLRLIVRGCGVQIIGGRKAINTIRLDYEDHAPVDDVEYMKSLGWKMLPDPAEGMSIEKRRAAAGLRPKPSVHGI